MNVTTEDVSPYDLVYFQAIKAIFGSIRLTDIVTDSDASYVNLENLYVEPALGYSSSRGSAYLPSSLGSSVIRALASKSHCVVLGDPGSGKSTLVSWIATRFATVTPNVYKENLGHLIPLPIVLRELSVESCDSYEQLLHLFLEEVNRTVKIPIDNVETSILNAMIGGRALIMLDGIDEIASIESRILLRRLIFEAQRRYPGCRWLFTSRPVGYEEVPFLTERLLTSSRRGSATSMAVLPGLDELSSDDGNTPVVLNVPDEQYGIYNVLPFDARRISSYAELWFRLREPVLSKANLEAKEFVDAVQAEPGLRQLARNPLLLAFLAFIHKRDVRLPSGKAEVYTRISEIFLDRIPLRKKLNDVPYRLDQKMRWLGKIALQMQLDGTVLWTHDEVRARLLVVLRIDDPESDDAKVDEFLRFVSRRAGLFLPRSEHAYGFVHRSFQEFFAAWSLSELVNSRKFNVPEGTLVTDPYAIRGFDAVSLGPSDLAAIVKTLGRSSSWSDTLLMTCSLVTEESGDILLLCLAGHGLLEIEIEDVQTLLRLSVSEDCRLSEAMRQLSVERINSVLCQIDDLPIGHQSFFAWRTNSDAYIARLKKSSPSGLMLFGVNASPSSFEAVLNNQYLQKVWLTSARVGRRAFAMLRVPELLEELYLFSVPQRSLNLEIVKELSSLRVLYIGCLPHVDGWLESLLSLRKLRVLGLRGRSRSSVVAPDVFLGLAALPLLKKLDLFDMRLSEEGANAIVSLPHLVDVSFEDCIIAPAARRILRGADLI